jgi:hypothetical protein
METSNIKKLETENKRLEIELEKSHKETEYWKKMFHKVNAYLIKK